MTKLHRHVFPAILVALLVLMAPFAGADERGDLSISRITPSGLDVPTGRQIVIEFNQPVVPLGDMARESKDIPVDISPALNCEWRWLSASALACELKEADALKPSTRYEVIVRPGIKTEQGKTLASDFKHSFLTNRITLDRTDFSGWAGPGAPSIMVVFNQPVRRDSVARDTVFVWSGGEEAVHVNEPAKWMFSSDDTLVTVEPASGWQGWVQRVLAYIPWLRPETMAGSEEWARRAWVVTPRKALPEGTEVELVAKQGLVGLGSEPSAAKQTLRKFATFGEFRFLGVRCTTNSGTHITIAPGQDKGEELCGPWNPVRFIFSAPVKMKEMRDHIVLSPELGRPNPDADPYASVNLELTEGFYSWSGHTGKEEYFTRAPQFLRADRDYEISLKQGAKLKDAFGRPLQGGIEARWRMDNRPPNFEHPNSVAVLEKGVDSEVPLYVNNLSRIDFTYSRLTAKGVQNGLKHSMQLDPIRNIQYAVPFGVRELLDGQSGAILGVFNASPKLPFDKSGFTFAQVTPFGVHVKLGHFNTLVWVSDLATAQPVAGARVSRVYDPAVNSALCNGKVQQDWTVEVKESAITDANGLAVLSGHPAKPGVWENACDRGLSIRVDKGDDMALMPLGYQFEVDLYRASRETLWTQDQSPQEHMRVWGMTAQGVYRAGDEIQYKVYVRGQDNKGLTAAPKGTYRLQLVDPIGKVIQDLKTITLNEFGAYAGEVTVPKTGAVGWYNFRLLQKIDANAKEPDDSGSPEYPLTADSYGALPSGWYAWSAARVLVSDFTPASFRVTANVDGKIFGGGAAVNVEGKAELHSGGPYTSAKARITAMFTPRSVSSSHPVASSFSFSRADSSFHSYPQTLAQLEEMLNQEGQVKTTIAIPDQGENSYGNLNFEVAVMDDRGKNVANSVSAIYASTDRFVGLKPKEWIYQAGKPAAYEYIVIDPMGQPVSGSKVDLQVEYKKVTAARVKSAGSVYQTVYNTTWEKAGTCSGTPDEKPTTCTVTPAAAGEYRITATVKGSKGKAHVASSDFWVTGRDMVLWDSGEDTALEIFPEKPDYKVGDTARYLVKNPYPNARALITVERYGVIDRFVQTFTSSTPVVEFQVKPEYAPGFYVSIVLLSPRVDKPLDANMVDLGKPAFRMGYISVPVTDPYNEITIKAEAEREEYRPGEQVKLALNALPKHGDKKAPVELAVAVLDQAVFDLIVGGKAYFDPYTGFYSLDNIDVRNYNLLLRLVGKQKFEKKGANPGGDGGTDFKFREDSKYIAYWNPSLRTDANGNAQVEFEAPDNLTGWQVLVIATTPTDKAGLGSAEFKVNRPTEIRPVMPNQVMEGDNFTAAFSVMNRTDKKRRISVEMQVEGHVGAGTKAMMKQEIDVEPYQRGFIRMPVVAGQVFDKGDDVQGEIRFIIRAGDAMDKDGYVFSLPVLKRLDFITSAFYGTSDREGIKFPIVFPKDIRPDAGELSVVLSPTIVTDVAGAFRYVADFPYWCWEQRVTKAVMAVNFRALKDYLPGMAWKESESVVADTLKSFADFQAPNGGMAYWVPQNDRTDPYLSAYTALAFSWMQERGVQRPEPMWANLTTYLENFLRKDTAPGYYSSAMTASVRAMALAALAKEGRVTLRDIERLRPQFASMDLFGKAMLLQAAQTLGGESGKALSSELTNMILAHSNQTSGKFLFTQQQGAGFARILSTPMRDNCAILSALTRSGPDMEQTAYKLARSVSQSQKASGRWANTQENVFCTNALADYASAFERTSPSIKLDVRLDNASIGTASLESVRATPVTVEHGIGAGDPGRAANVEITREGEGRYYYGARLRYASTAAATQPINSGIELRREYSVERDGKWVLLEENAEISRGELVRVDIFLSAPAARNFVVVDDPVPGGLEPVNRDLATASAVDADKAWKPAQDSYWTKQSDWVEFASTFWSFYHQELRHDSVRFYSDHIEAGNYHLSYVAQAVATGTFQRRAAKAEEMYDPEVFGRAVPGMLTVKELQ